MDRQEKAHNKTEDYCEWAYDQLITTGFATQKAFLERYCDSNGVGKKDHKEENRLRSEWSRVKHTLLALLRRLGADIKKAGRADLRLVSNARFSQHSELEQYTNERFHPAVEREPKEFIARLIAEFLQMELLADKTIFLGSGTTIFHLGLQMREQGHYDQRFVTVNIPLVTAWCKQGNKAVDWITIPAAEIDTRSFRFSTMPEFPFPLTVSIVGADGCFYDGERVVLYGNRDPVSANTSRFVENTMHSVLVCLTSSKIEKGFSKNPDTGPPISPPKKGVIRVLVTDRIAEEASKAFQRDGWFVVTEMGHWDPVLAAMKEGQKTPRST